MIDIELIADAPAGPLKPKTTAAQKALFERTALPLSTLVHGDHYLGLLDDFTVSARWHSQRRRFVCSLHVAGQPVLKAVPHVADLGTGARFAPIAPQTATPGTHISDFALETTR
jgi:hypothetical protein